MRRRISKIAAVALAFMLVLSIMTACGSKSTEKEPAGETSSTGGTAAATETKAAEGKVPEEFVTLKIIYPDAPSKRMDEFLGNEFKQKMKEDLNLEVEISWIPWDQYWNKKDIMITAGEQIDWYWDGGPGFAAVVGKNECAPLDELLETYGQDIKRIIPAENFDAFKVNGKLMAIPSQAAPTAEKFTSVLLRQDLMDEVGITEVKSVADLENLYEAVKAKHPDIKFAADVPPIDREYYDFPFTFTGEASCLIVNEDTKKVEVAWFTEGWKKKVKKAAEWAQKGYIGEELTIKPQEGIGRMETGKYLCGTGAISRPLENINELRNNVPNAKLIEVLIAPEKPRMKWLSSTEIFVISPTAKYPDRAMMMMNWFYKSQENYMFAIYGIEGKDYKINNGRIEQINTDSLWYEWMFRNTSYIQFPNTVSDAFIDSYKKWDDNARLSCLFGFAFNQEPVAAEAAKISQLLQEQVIPISTGYISFDKSYPKLVEDLKAAGIEKYVAEYQKQLDAYLASK